MSSNVLFCQKKNHVQQSFSRLRLEPEKLLLFLSIIAQRKPEMISHSSKILADHFLLVY